MDKATVDMTSIIQELDKHNDTREIKTLFKAFVKLTVKRFEEQSNCMKQLQQELQKTKNDLIETSMLNTKILLQHQELQAKVAKASTEKNNAMDKSSVTSADDKERKRSVVVAKIPESKEDTVSKRIAEDSAKVAEIINSLGVEACIDKCYRLGVRTGAKDRLLKVVLCTSSQQQSLISTYRQSRHNEYYLRPSLSQEELKEIQNKRNQIRELKKMHPQMIFVLYRNQICVSEGDPKIKPRVFDGELPSFNPSHPQ